MEASQAARFSDCKVSDYFIFLQVIFCDFYFYRPLCRICLLTDTNYHSRNRSRNRRHGA